VKAKLFSLILVTASLSFPTQNSVAASSKTLTNYAGIYQSSVSSSAAAKAGSTQKYIWNTAIESGDSFRQLIGLSVFDKYTSRNFTLIEIESVWINETLNISCYTSGNSPVGKTSSNNRINFLDPFPVVQSDKLTYKNDEINKVNIAINFSVNQKCAEIRVATNNELWIQSAVKDANGITSSRAIWLDAKYSNYQKIESISGVKKPSIATPTSKPTTKKPTATKKSAPSKASPKTATCSIFQGEKIYATYGQAEPPFGVTTIKFENITDCILDVTIRGDFIGSSNNQQLRCPVVGNWSLQPYSRVEFAPAGTVNGGVAFQTVFPQLSNCFRTINAQKNFIAVITAGRE
jgi:hypothetical protein